MVFTMNKLRFVSLEKRNEIQLIASEINSLRQVRMIIYIYIYTGKPPPGSRNQWFTDQLVTGSIVGHWLQVTGDLFTYWLPSYRLPGYWLLASHPVTGWQANRLPVNGVDCEMKTNTQAHTHTRLTGRLAGRQTGPLSTE